MPAARLIGSAVVPSLVAVRTRLFRAGFEVDGPDRRGSLRSVIRCCMSTPANL
jgi:hypothetical protein